MPRFRTPTGLRCNCGSGLPVLTHSRLCYSCEAYNAAVKAMQAFAKALAATRLPNNSGDGAWVNEFGCFGRDDKVVGLDVATAEEVAAVERLTTEVRHAAEKHWRNTHPEDFPETDL